MDYSLPGSSVHGIFQARILEWAAISFSTGSSWPRDQTQVSLFVGRRFAVWATREAYKSYKECANCKKLQGNVGNKEYVVNKVVTGIKEYFNVILGAAVHILETPVCHNPLGSPWCANVPGLGSTTPTEIISKNCSNSGTHASWWEECCTIAGLFAFPKTPGKRCYVSVYCQWLQSGFCWEPPQSPVRVYWILTVMSAICKHSFCSKSFSCIIDVL